MSINGFNMPTEIPWERICVTKDMLDQGVCDEDMPGKWRSSIAVFKYVPEDEYQTYPNREISYLKLAVTICGFQPRDKEIEGRIIWSGVSNTIIKDVEKLLNEYHPCTGAIVQLTVAPKKERGATKVRPEDYPYLMDFQPKKRELYEMATDTKERASRSLESLNLRKASGTTQSLEILDVDMGVVREVASSLVRFKRKQANRHNGVQSASQARKSQLPEVPIRHAKDVRRSRTPPSLANFTTFSIPTILGRTVGCSLFSLDHTPLRSRVGLSEVLDQSRESKKFLLSLTNPRTDQTTVYR